MTRPLRRIDHLVLAVHDLDAAGSFYERLGFRVGARNRHPWGTENRLVQFRSSFLELVTVADSAAIPTHAPGLFSFGAFVRDYLAAREGLAMFVLDSPDAVADAERFAAAGIGDFQPFSFERMGRRPDGQEARVGFSLAFAVDDAAPDASFFVCQQHHPEAFWSPLFQRHDNGATDVAAVSFAVSDPKDHVAFLTAFTGVRPSRDPNRFELAQGQQIELAGPDASNRLAGFTIAVPDLDSVAKRLTYAHLPFTATQGRVEIDARHGFGAVIAFETR